MKILSAIVMILPVVFCALTHFYREDGSLFLTFFGFWMLFTLFCPVWGLCISRKHRSLAWSCVAVGLFQIVLFATLVMIDGRAKTKSTASEGRSGLTRQYSVNAE
jgi:hypothetical protein